MRIVKEEQNLMILKDNSIALYLIGIIFFLVGIALILKPGPAADQFPFWLSVLQILAGGFIIVTAATITIKLDKLNNKVSILHRSLFGQSRKEYDLKQIKEIDLSAAYNTSSKGRNYSYHLAFRFNDGSVVPLNPGSSSITRIMGKQIIPEKALGARIAGFLGVPFQERRPPTVSELLSAFSAAVRSSVEKEREKRE